MSPANSTRNKTTLHGEKKETTQIVTAHKRTLSPDANEKVYTKRVKTIKLSMADLNELKKFIADNSNALENGIKESQTSLQKSLETKFDCLASKFNEEVIAIKNTVNDFKAEVASEISEIKSQVSHNTKNVENNLEKTNDAIQRMQRSHILRLVGFKYKENENLSLYVTKVANEIGFVSLTQNIASTIERIPYKDRKTETVSQSNTILIHFNEPRQKELFYSQYLKKMPLNPLNLGLPESNRIVIGEFLTGRNAAIFKRAQEMKKDKKLAQVYTSNGLVRVRLLKGKTETTHTICDKAMLDILIAQQSAIQQESESTSFTHAEDSGSKTPANTQATTSATQASLTATKEVNAPTQTPLNTLPSTPLPQTPLSATN